ncbi:uncharacterized protein LOC112598949 [Melanaphis sacchari]|uniref:uncharacterized protein LOC112598949 n=1 Tax=Melanaphis sacchari TaxID=742174 RepID=UPI000DC15208|nr:uncharacterized protein LOC112598949 [Melanaphis sacchari]
MIGETKSVADVDVERRMATGTFKYVTPTPPAVFIDSTNFTIDFSERKFLHVGLDQTKKFDVSILIITPSRFVKISTDFLRRIYSLMGQILSYILDTAVQYKRFILLETESISISSMGYKGETVLVIESRTEIGCRILLNRKDLMVIQHLETIFESASRKISFIKPMVQDQIEKIAVHFSFLHSGKTCFMDDMIAIIASNHGENIQKTKHCILNELILFATQQIATRWFEIYKYNVINRAKVYNIS